MNNIETVKDLINALGRAKKNLRMYPVNHPMYEKTVDDFNSKMSPCVEVDSIRIRINQYDILFNDEVIYHSRDKDESLALFFFKDGLRELSFLKGITRSEIKDFLRIISLDFEKEVLDDDIVTLLWEEDLQHIKYLVDDTFLHEDEAYELKAVEQAKSAGGRTADIMKAYESAINLGSSSKADIIQLTNDDIQHIVKEVENNHQDKNHTLVRILFEMLYLARKNDECDVVAGCIKQALNHAIMNAHLETVNYVLINARRDLKRPACPEQVNVYLETIYNYINSADFINMFGDVINNGAVFPIEVLKEFGGLLNINSIPHYVSILGEMKNISSRRTVINILTEAGRRDIALVANGLNDRRWYVVRNIVYILRQIRDKSSVEYIIKTAGHPDKRVKKEVVHALGEMGADKVLDIIKEYMSDGSESVRIAAFRAAGQIGTPSSKRLVIEQISSKNFPDKDFSEKKEILKVLSRWKEKSVIDFLVRIIQKRGLFNSTKNNETRAAAIHCLGLMGADDVRQFAERYKESNNTLLRTQALKILKSY
jgi:hypothetical protein